MKTKLNQNLCCAAKNHAKNIDTIEKNTNNDGKKEDELRHEEDLKLLDAQSFENAVELTYIQGRKMNDTDCLKFSILSHMLYFLYVADDQNTSISKVFYNMNLLKTDSLIS